LVRVAAFLLPFAIFIMFSFSLVSFSHNNRTLRWELQ
jgi:hypothetical protein